MLSEASVSYSGNYWGVSGSLSFLGGGGEGRVSMWLGYLGRWVYCSVP